MTPPIPGLEALQPTDEAARKVLTSWQELRDSMQTLCGAPTAEEKATVLTWMDSVVSAYESFQSELKLLRQSLQLNDSAAWRLPPAEDESTARPISEFIDRLAHPEPEHQQRGEGDDRGDRKQGHNPG